VNNHYIYTNILFKVIPLSSSIHSPIFVSVWEFLKIISDKSFSLYFRCIFSHFIFVRNRILQNFLAVTGKSKTILSRENIYGGFFTVVTICQVKYCLTSNDPCTGVSVQKRASYLVHPFFQIFLSLHF